ncbi:MAG: VOC family protein [Gammaproteobacteria bacterium]|nr:VOC family protein [Gammaproteobacteria bacterium]
MFSFHHVSLNVSDLDKTKQFYAMLGFESVLEWVSPSHDLSIVHLKLGDAFVELFCYKENKFPPTNLSQSQLGLQHFALKVESIDLAKKAIVQAGLVSAEDLEVIVGRTGIIYFFLKDPDGNLIEIVEDKRSFIKPTLLNP